MNADSTPTDTRPQIGKLLEFEVGHAISEADLYEEADVHRQVEVVRQIRKSTKRSRAIVSLLDPQTGERFNRHLRHCARQLSAMQDRDVILQTLGELSDMDPKLHGCSRRRTSWNGCSSSGTRILRVPVSEGDVITSVRAELGWILEHASCIGRRNLRWETVIFE